MKVIDVKVRAPSRPRRLAEVCVKFGDEAGRQIVVRGLRFLRSRGADGRRIVLPSRRVEDPATGERVFVPVVEIAPEEFLDEVEKEVRAAYRDWAERRLPSLFSQERAIRRSAKAAPETSAKKAGAKTPAAAFAPNGAESSSEGAKTL